MQACIIEGRNSGKLDIPLLNGINMPVTNTNYLTNSQILSENVSTPSRFLVECGEYSLASSLTPLSPELNPFDISFQKQFPDTPLSPLAKPVATTVSHLPNMSLPNSNQDGSPYLALPLLSTLNSSVIMVPEPALNTSAATGDQASSEISANDMLLASAIYEPSKPAYMQTVNPLLTEASCFKRKRSREDWTSETDDHSSFSIPDGCRTVADDNNDKWKQTASRFNSADDEKRRRCLERNRIAAYKCRQKRKQWIQELETAAEGATSKNQSLLALVSQLKEQVLELKRQLLEDHDCGCNMVRQYVQSNGYFGLLNSHQVPLRQNNR